MAFLLSEELSLLPVRPHPNKLGPMDVPETEIVVNAVGPTVQTTPDQGGHGMEYTEYNNNNYPTLPHSGHQPNPSVPRTGQTLIYLPALGPDGSRVPKVVQLSDRNAHGFLFPENNKTGIPQEAQTQTTISWQPFKQSKAYIVTCHPITQHNEKMFQVSKAIRTHCLGTFGCLWEIKLDGIVLINQKVLSDLYSYRKSIRFLAHAIGEFGQNIDR